MRATQTLAASPLTALAVAAGGSAATAGAAHALAGGPSVAPAAVFPPPSGCAPGMWKPVIRLHRHRRLVCWTVPRQAT